MEWVQDPKSNLFQIGWLTAFTLYVCLFSIHIAILLLGKMLRTISPTSTPMMTTIKMTATTTVTERLKTNLNAAAREHEQEQQPNDPLKAEMDEDTPPFSSHRIAALLGNSTDRLVVGNGRSALLPARVSELQLSAFNWRFLSSSTAVESSPCINKQSNRQRKQDIQIFS